MGTGPYDLEKSHRKGAIAVEDQTSGEHWFVLETILSDVVVSDVGKLEDVFLSSEHP